MSNYEDNQGLLSRCSQKFDSKSNKFVKATEGETVNCCLEQCGDLNNVCKEKCIEYENLYGDKNNPGDEYKIKRCYHTCYVLNNKLCTNKCRSISEGMHALNNDYVKCANELGCENMINMLPSVDCISKNRESIRECCLNKCDPFENNCDELCDFLEDSILNPIIPKQEFKINVEDRVVKINRVNYLIIVILPVITMLICLLIFNRS